MKLKPVKPKILVFDIESFANRGYFYEVFSDRGIPLAFIEKAKAVCTIAYKWLGEKKVNVIGVETPYEDAGILAEFMKVWEQADYVLAHFGDNFDVPFLSARLFANKLPPLPIVAQLDTYKLAKKHFGRTLNSNSLDHLGEILGLGRKQKTDASLWVRCANGEKKAMKEMKAYNVQDVELLEQIWLTMEPYVDAKVNYNHFTTDTLGCKACGSTHLQKRGTFLTKMVRKHRIQCQICGKWDSIKYEKEETKAAKAKKASAKVSKPPRPNR